MASTNRAVASLHVVSESYWVGHSQGDQRLSTEEWLDQKFSNRRLFFKTRDAVFLRTLR